LGILAKASASGDSPPSVHPLRARQLLALVGVYLAPAATAGAIASAHTGRVGDGVLLFSVVLGATALLGGVRYPLHLMPTSQVALPVAASLLAGTATLGLVVSGATNLTVSELVSLVVAASLIALLGRTIQVRFEASRPIRVAMISSHALAASLARELRSAGVESYAVVGWISVRESPADRLNGIRRLGSLSELRSIVTANHIDLLVCGADRAGALVDGDDPHGGLGSAEEPFPHAHRERRGQVLVYEHIAHACLDLPVRMLDTNQLSEELLGHVPIGTIDAQWFRYIMHPRYRPGSPLSKRIFDLVLGSVTALISLPIVAIAAVAIKLDTPGPVLYRQRRVGEHGREFEMLKLRTMGLDSEPDGTPQWSSAGDERVTRVGRVLRRLHVDELPQLWNVLRGEMTLVGPRPERPELVAQLERQFPHYERRHLVKPGVTGWAQIRCGYAGSEMGSGWKLCHDLYYLKHRSLLADLLLVAQTATILARDAEAALRDPDEQFILGGAEQVGTVPDSSSTSRLP
jgi:exopolysaccharide biosynthesis polyprenyl glycosylphosphotransferase